MAVLMPHEIMARTADLFPIEALPPKPRAPRLWRMHVIDAGIREDGAEIAVFKCSRCGHETRWTEFRTITEAKRGLPCPNCNKAQS